MIDRLIEFSAHNRFLVLLLIGAAAVAGWWSLQSIKSVSSSWRRTGLW